MAQIGKRNKLLVLKDSAPGLYLDGGDLGQILLPQPPRTAKPDDILDVFIYRDSEDRLVATTRTPKVQVGEFALLQVVAVNQIGAFLDWGLSKDLLLPVREQKKLVKKGDSVLVYVYLEPESQRIAATTRVENHLDLTPATYKKGQTVNLLITDKTPLGFNAIIENAHRGLIYHDLVRKDLSIGQRLTGFIGAPREDGKIDLNLEPLGYQRIAPLTDQILEALRANDGRLAMDDSSSPEEIRERFATSKKAFKQALGALYKQRLIDFGPGGICLRD